MPAPSTARRRPKPPRARGPGFVGRDNELGVLRAEFAQARAAELRCVLLVGEAGVGKTRLAAELLAHVHARAVTLSARAYPLGATASFGLWAEALEGHLRGLTREEVVALCGGFLDDLAGLLHSVAAARGSVPHVEPPRLRLLEALAVVLSNLARQESVVVVLDDVHHADSSSWEALHYLALNLQAMPVLVVASARPAELADHPVAPQVLFGLEQEGLLQRLAVGRLDTDAVGELAAGVVGRSPPAALVEWLETRSRGNALFALGLLQALIDEGADLAAPTLRRIPEALADRVGSRLKLLDEPALATIELLAVLGRRVGIVELVEMSSRPRDRLDEILSGLLRAGLVVEEERGRELTYEIAHPLIQEAIYQRIGGGRRRALHRLAGRSLLAAGRPGDAAPHFSRSADHGDAEATGALCEALRQAEQREADREALEILGALVDLVPSHHQAWTDVARAMTWHADWVVDHRFDNADLGVRAMREISAVLGRSGDVAGRAAANLRLASFLAWGTPELGEAERVCRQALELFEQAGDVHRMLLARNELGWIKGIGGDAAAMEAEGEQVVDAARELGDRFALMQGSTTTGNAAMFLGRFEAAEAALGTSLAIAAEDGKLYEQTRVLSVLAMSRAYEGRMQAALDAIRQAKSVNPAVPPTWEPLAHWMRGNVREALAAIQAGMAWKPIGTSRRRSVLLAFAALSLAEADEVGEAERYRVAARKVYDGPFMYFSSYSGREREVASLASQGLSAREIADRLYIGERTVEGHLASIYAKLGIRSKTDLVRRASEFPV